MAPVKNQGQCNSYSSWIVTVDSACNGEQRFCFRREERHVHRGQYSYNCLATKGTCKASNCNAELAQGSVLRYKDVPTDSEQRFCECLSDGEEAHAFSEGECETCDTIIGP